MRDRREGKEGRRDSCVEMRNVREGRKEDIHLKIKMRRERSPWKNVGKKKVNSGHMKERKEGKKG